MKRKETANRLNRPWMLAVGIGCLNLYVIVTFKMACEVKIKFFFLCTDFIIFDNTN